MPACLTCEAREWLAARAAGREPLPLPEATYVSSGPNPFPLCDAHMPYAIIAGWKPVKIDADPSVKNVAEQGEVVK
jgi:hypothetical protein